MITFNEKTIYEIADVQGKPYMFIDLRVDRKTVPDNMYVYEIADGDGDGCFARIQDHVMVNFWGTLIGKEPLDFGELGAYFPPFGSAEYEGLFIGSMTLEEYMNADPDELIPDKEEGRRVRDGEYILMDGNSYTSELHFEKTSMDQYNEEEFTKLLIEELSFCITIEELRFLYDGSDIRCSIQLTAEATESIQCIIDTIRDVAEECGLSLEGEWPEFIPVSKEEVNR